MSDIVAKICLSPLRTMAWSSAISILIIKVEPVFARIMYRYRSTSPRFSVNYRVPPIENLEADCGSDDAFDGSKMQ